MKWYLKVMSQYADFKGRARRQEFWMFLLFNLLFSFVALLIDEFTGMGTETGGPISGLYWLATFIPSLAVLVRRLHDIGKSGWWILIGFIPIIGAIWLIILEATDSTPGPNQYGPNPKGISA